MSDTTIIKEPPKKETQNQKRKITFERVIEFIFLFSALFAAFNGVFLSMNALRQSTSASMNTDLLLRYILQVNVHFTIAVSLAIVVSLLNLYFFKRNRD